MNILVLCHGKNYYTKRISGETCNTSYNVNIKKATLLDKDKTSRPDIVHDWRLPIAFKKKYNVITTMCCDSDAFYDDSNKKIEHHTFANVANALTSRGVFMMPKYSWMCKKTLSEIKKHLHFVKSFQKKHEIFYVFSKLR